MQRADDDRVAESWDAIEGWLTANHPALLETLSPGAADGELARAEAELGRPLPADVRASYLRHDGQAGLPGLLEGWRLLSLDEALAEWRTYQADRAGGAYACDDLVARCPGVKDVLWDEGWVPVSGLGASENHCVDLCPGPGGQAGQLIRWQDDGTRRVVAPSLGAWLAGLARGLQAGDYAVDDDGALRAAAEVRPRAAARTEDPDERRRRIVDSDFGRQGGWEVELGGVRLGALTLVQRGGAEGDRYRLYPLSRDPADRAALYDPERWLKGRFTLRSRAFGDRVEARAAGGPDVEAGTIVLKGLQLPAEATLSERLRLGWRRLVRRQ